MYKKCSSLKAKPDKTKKNKVRSINSDKIFEEYNGQDSGSFSIKVIFLRGNDHGY